jgi:hypothetical protein
VVRSWVAAVIALGWLVVIVLPLVVIVGTIYWPER